MHDEYMAFQLRMVLMIAQQPAAKPEDPFSVTRTKAQELEKLYG